MWRVFSTKPNRAKLVFAALGDSLTVGYQPPEAPSYAPKFTPYTDFLKTIVDAEWSDRVDAVFHNLGICGELTSDMMTQVDTEVASLSPDYAIVLAGGSDIWQGCTVEEVAQNLFNVYEALRSRGIGLICCSLPSVLGFDEQILPRIRLNKLIEGYARATRSFFADIFEATVDPMSLRLREDLSSDGVHLNEAGYLEVAKTIYAEAVKPILEERLG